ncbi:MFS phosphate transporter [Aspergillus saccharolyticus JOP 1030-1]|uniref:MFS phosphate transporter n=1 Tax=Aspergillus saccharolyticus JOP 1030-1 TaxID=1450539 RepID=A0A318ZWR4_9EURO|nr:MFS phosphate transporter [Aspergillus saccharolyticus JOP 1030-1]PYH48540.1 MFS phosphate transporter [Aspergillus saccharolyticus JOP 1030-1]
MADFDASHEPSMGGKQEFPEMSPSERDAFNRLLRPDDSYTPEGVYWADLPIGQRIKFVRSVDSKESSRQWSLFWQQFKADPLSPLMDYFKNVVIPGAGIGLEGYVLLSIGNISTLFGKSFESCWGKYEICSKTWVSAVTYLEIVGIIIGQIMVGVIGDWIGRRWGLLQDAWIMILGLVMLVAAWGTTQNGWVICYAWSLFIYGVGVGGEYPMTVTSGMENAVGSGKLSTREDRLHRGAKVIGCFSMQGWGQVLNQAFLMILLLIFNAGSGKEPINQTAAQWTYRISFVIPLVGTVWLLYYRAYHMKAASKQLAATKKQAKVSVTGYDTESLRLTFKYFTPRVLATAGGWFANDVFFYGAKLFSSDFIAVISPKSTSIFTSWQWSFIDVVVTLAGYYFAIAFVDNKLYGRKWMQIWGFLLCFIMFVVPAFKYDYYTQPAHIHSFQAMYFLSSFFNQFGPNCVTFLVAGEVFPTPIRATAHGISAATGKLGALMAGVLFNYIDTQTKFYFVPWWGLLGMALTYLFLPDTTGLDLKEQERRWIYIRSGREHEYHGVAVHPKHLSVWERFRGAAKHYDPELDYQQRLREYRAEWETKMARMSEETKRGDDVDAFIEDELLEGSVHDYFYRTSSLSTAHTVGKETEAKDL